MYRNGLAKGIRYQLMDTVYHFQASRATNPRDHLFALLGLASDANHEGLRPLYAENGSVLQNCLRYAHYFLHKKSNLEVLYRAGMHGHKLLAPSWVPNWYGGQADFGFEYAQGLWDPLQRPFFYNVARGTGVKFIETEDHHILGLKGRLIDKATDLANRHLQVPVNQVQDKDTMLVQKREHLEESDAIISSLETYPTGEDKLDVHWRTLICNITLGLEHAPDSYRIAFEKYRKALRLAGTANAEEMQMQRLFREVIDSFSGGKIFRKTASGYVGMFPAATEAGDVIAVLYGGEFPFVMRKLTSETKANYELVGQCYIHGIMEDGRLDLTDPRYEEKDIFLGGDFEEAEPDPL